MKTFFNQLFDYNFYCNKKLIEQVCTFDKVPENTKRLFSHLLNAHHIWNHRLTGEPKAFDVWQLHEVKDWGDIHYENQRTTFEVISNTEDFHVRIDYETTEGRLFANDLRDVLFHIINHSTHHRAQILMDFRTHGVAPEPLDYILYKR
ncbi:DinB family protein [Croceitalea dokdonensis DOKDO 023]|uniref:DinB family protein n=1 Tax=Croceitalea dokdonensis DOKDO 023 TaxID=1300341 RepID=A0A0P7AJG8_9FLAO|nr:DinB family protein [Croceitalea dokdonensis]KPM31951.1 DinB family protein [Croceitalea dokdonensis DOKDO 023]